METRRISPYGVKRTYVFAEENPKWMESHRRLSELFEKNEDVPPIAVVKDPDSGDLYVYNGNACVTHAIMHGYLLKAKIISDQDDFNEYLRNDSMCWFGIADFPELLEYMRIYARFPREDEGMPRVLEQRVREKYYEWQEKKRQQMAEVFGWHDD